jgi:paraquat-inducible protein A
VGEELVACHDCDLVHRIPVEAEGRSGRCIRCGGVLFDHKPRSIERTLALAIAGVVLFLVANAFPFLSFDMQGRETQTTLLNGIHELWSQGMGSLAGLVLVTAVIAPGIQLVLLLYVLVPLHGGRVPWQLALALRALRRVESWSMMEVFLIGILVALVKLGRISDIVPGLAIYSFGVLIAVLAGAAVTLDRRALWRRVEVQT